MARTHSFEILSRRKIPYWTSFVFALIATCCTFLFLLYLAMSPSEHASGEMQVAYYILVIPEWLKQTSSYSALGLLALFPIYSYSKRYKVGSVFFNAENITLSEETETVIPIERISTIIVNDVRPFFSKESAEVILKQGKIIRASFLLRHYIQSDELLQALSIYEHVQFIFYNEVQLQDFDKDDDCA